MDKFWDFINNHWVFNLRKEPIESYTQMTYELHQRNDSNYEGMFLDLLSVFTDYVESKEITNKF